VLAQANRLRRPADFRAAIREGWRCGGRLTVVYVAPANRAATGQEAVWQAGLVVSKAVGNSVVRHRVSRRLRAILANEMPKLPEPRRVVVRALGAAGTATYSELERTVAKCLRKVA
jgi:ribonuclease P protein component